jgi:hypothetical protein
MLGFNGLLAEDSNLFQAEWNNPSVQKRKGETMIAKASVVTRPDATPSISISHQVGFYAAILTTVMTIVTFGFAITALPNAGANCLEDCIDYPYLDSMSQFPGDYLWMFPALVLLVVYVILMTSIHATAAAEKKIFSQIGLSFALMAAVILMSIYFLQFSVIPVSLRNGETEGITLLTQYNPHGIFIALEELGYLIMSLSFLFVAPVFTAGNRVTAAVRWIFILGFVLAIVALAGYSIVYGLERQDRFEIAVISIDWLVLIANGALLSVLFRRQLMGLRTA